MRVYCSHATWKQIHQKLTQRIESNATTSANALAAIFALRLRRAPSKAGNGAADIHIEHSIATPSVLSSILSAVCHSPEASRTSTPQFEASHSIWTELRLITVLIQTDKKSSFTQSYQRTYVTCENNHSWSLASSYSSDHFAGGGVTITMQSSVTGRL